MSNAVIMQHKSLAQMYLPSSTYLVSHFNTITQATPEMKTEFFSWSSVVSRGLITNEVQGESISDRLHVSV